MRRRNGKRDYTFPLVLALLLLFPFAVDQMFVRLRVFMHAEGFFAMSDLSPVRRPLKNQHCRGGVRGAKGFDPAWPLCSGTVATEAEVISATSSLASNTPRPDDSLAALAAAESGEWNVIRGRLGSRNGPQERWTAVAPGPSNPSRYFPEPRHPLLTSGVPLTTGPTDSHWEDPAPLRAALPEREAKAPLSERRIASIVIATPAQQTTQEAAPAPRLQFHAKAPIEKASHEKLIEVCGGRMVPESQAATASAECAPKAAAVKTNYTDEGGNDTLLLP